MIRIFHKVQRSLYSAQAFAFCSSAINSLASHLKNSPLEGEILESWHKNYILEFMNLYLKVQEPTQLCQIQSLTHFSQIAYQISQQPQFFTTQEEIFTSFQFLSNSHLLYPAQFIQLLNQATESQEAIPIENLLSYAKTLCHFPQVTHQKFLDTLQQTLNQAQLQPKEYETLLSLVHYHAFQSNPQLQAHVSKMKDPSLQGLPTLLDFASDKEKTLETVLSHLSELEDHTLNLLLCVMQKQGIKEGWSLLECELLERHLTLNQALLSLGCFYSANQGSELLFQKCERIFYEQRAELTAEEWLLVVEMFDGTGYANTAFFEAVQTDIGAQLKNFGQDALLDVLVVYEKLGILEEHVFQIAKKLIDIEELSDVQMAKLVYVLARADMKEDFSDRIELKLKKINMFDSKHFLSFFYYLSRNEDLIREKLLDQLVEKIGRLSVADLLKAGQIINVTSLKNGFIDQAYFDAVKKQTFLQRPQQNDFLTILRNMKYPDMKAMLQSFSQ